MKGVDSKERARAVYQAAADKKAEGVVVLDVREVTALADYFVICSGQTQRQVRAIADEIDFRLSAQKVFPLRVEGLPLCAWVLMDYGDVVVHVFEDEAREYYDLEGLWGDAPKVEF